MKTRGELKSEARELLAGNWGKAIRLNILPIMGSVIVFFLLALATAILKFFARSDYVGNVFTGDPTYAYSYSDTVAYTAEPNVTTIVESVGRNSLSSLIGMMIMVGIGYTTLDWLRTKNNDFSVARGMFAVFSKKYFVSTLVLYILMAIFEFLWSLLFVIPGIIKGFSYSQTYYIYKDVNQNNEDNNLSYLDYITLSRELMNGHKFELFVLELSFIGWWLLVMVTFGLAAFWVYPYYQTTKTAYYKELAGDTFVNYQAA